MQNSPIITKMQVIPVAGYDGMLMTLSGAHAPCFTRNLVVLTDNAGHTGVGEIHGGTARNVIAGSAYLTGTVRTYSDTAHEMMPELIKRIVTHTAMALGADAELTDYTVANVKVENEAASSERARAALVKVLGEEAVGRYRGTLSGEDFSAYLQHVPGMLAFVGCRNPQIGATFAQHSCFYKVDESVLAKGSMLAAQYAVDFLAED